MDFLLSQNNIWIILIALGSGLMLLWPSIQRGRNSDQLSLQEAVQLVNHEHGLFVDVRPAEQFKSGAIPQARNIPSDKLESQLDKLPRNKPIVLVDSRGRESARLAGKLRKGGLERVSCLEGGMAAWTEGGMPLKKS